MCRRDVNLFQLITSRIVVLWCFLSDTITYVSIVHYLSAVSQLHKLYDYDIRFTDNSMVKFTLAGLLRTLGDPEPSTCPRPVANIQTCELIFA